MGEGGDGGTPGSRAVSADGAGFREGPIWSGGERSLGAITILICSAGEESVRRMSSGGGDQHQQQHLHRSSASSSPGAIGAIEPTSLPYIHRASAMDIKERYKYLTVSIRFIVTMLEGFIT